MSHGVWRHLAAGCAAVEVMAAACQHRSDAPGPPRSEAVSDSLAGIVQVVGVAASPRIVLVREGTPTLTLVGPASLANLNGLKIGVVGQVDGSKLAVSRFTVLEANGVSATDGRLIAEGDDLYLETADHVRHRLVNPSPRLRERVGHRVWVSGPLDKEPVAYGFID
jgi:hypothetical protein